MVSNATRDVLRPLRLPGYSFLALTIVLQMADFFLTIWPFRLSAIMWRFATLAQASGNVGNTLLLILLLYVFALLLQDSPALATITIVAIALAVLLFLAGAAFALDAVQLRNRVDPQAVRRFDMAAAEAIIKFFTQGVISALMAVSGLRSWRIAKRPARRSSEEFLITRSTPTPRPAED